MYTLTLLSITLIAGQVAASSALSARHAHGVRDVLRRASNSSVSGFTDIPSACTSACKTLTAAQNCTASDLACLCNEDLNQGAFTCYQCVLGQLSPNQTLLAEGQQKLSAYEAACATSASVTLKSLTLTLPGSASTLAPVANAQGAADTGAAAGLSADRAAVAAVLGAALAALL
ncbi:uncharacterized protein BXZ73DRAFT_98267 [Epithele typhae]|uniref:uncharacterized protein n=1 Tax=Epithele typhae TaxID=378194 RepID=UPI002007DB03|nr:uncharacterized protein BXZ73DRAFT_98267 [Epithele typhae]KAH9941880.1 hypothetical protein BXZ73DRAFT_98267 [Epithele typhae]